MGIIRRQSIKGSIYTYIGTLLGFVNLAILAPKILSADQIGLTQVMVSVATIMAQFATLGFNSVTSRLFPYFRSDKAHHNGFLFIQTVVGFSGYILMLIVFFLLKDVLIERNQEKSPLFVEYIILLVPLLFFLTFHSLFDSYNRIIFNATLGTFLKEVLVRLGNLGIILLYNFDVISFNTYVYLFVGILGLPPFLIVLYLLYTRKLSLLPKRGFISRDLRREMIRVSMFGIIAGFSGIALSNIDKYMVTDLLGLSYAGVYSIAFYFGSLILIPNRAVSKISVTVLAENWKENNKKSILSIYRKSCSIQYIFAGLILLLLVANIHNIFQVLPEEYGDGKWVIILIGLANVLNMFTGVSGQVIITSPAYKYQNYIMLILIGVVVLTNYIFIPILGIVGAAVAFLISTFVVNLMKFSLLWWKYGFQPYTRDFIYITIIIAVMGFLGELIPEMSFWPDLIIRSAIITLIYSLIIYFSKFSEEFNELVNWVFKLVGIRINR